MKVRSCLFGLKINPFMMNTLFQHSFLSALALAALLPLSAQTALTDADLTNAYHTKTVTGRISVHDPSIVADGDNYYIYGSHLGHGKTSAASNYQAWTTWGAGEASGTSGSLFANASGNLINFADAYSTQAYTGKVKNYQGAEADFIRFDAHGWQAKGNSVQGMQWAPDIIFNKTMKKWCMYMSLNGDSWCSSIVLFTSDSAEGPWIYQGPVVMSGFGKGFTHNGYSGTDDWKRTDLALATGATSLPARYAPSDNYGNYWPNCIDPCVYYDDDDNLWMSYGSWSGGIFVLRLDKTTGLRDYTYTFPYQINGVTVTPGAASKACTSDPYFGKKIAGGYYVSGEGSYIKKIGKYWFLFLSYGGLNPSQGYQMRIFRSEHATGPFVDANGTSALYSNYKMNYGSNAATDRGVLLMNGYQWETMSTGEVAQGHNSAFVDGDGRAFVVYHTKFNDGSFGHQVRVHQLFLNEDGWLVADPYEFDGGTTTDAKIASTASIADEEIPGNYQIILHEYKQAFAPVSKSNEATTAKLQQPKDITLNADGTVTGALTGSWKRTAGTDYITLTLSGVAYKGVLFHQTVDYTDMSSLNIAALSSGASTAKEIWASKVDAKAAIKYTLDHYQVPFVDGATINKDVLLPSATGNLGATVTWKSSDENVYDTDFGEPVADGPVVLTMTVSKDGYSYSKEYKLNVSMNGKSSTPVYYPVSAEKNVTNAFFTNFTQAYTLTKGNEAEFKFVNYSDKAQNWDNWLLVLSTTAHGATGYKEYLVLRNDAYGWTPTANTTDNSWYTSMTHNFNWNTFKEDMDGSTVDMTCSYAQEGTFTMKAKITTKAGKVYNYSFVMPIPGAPNTLTLFFTGEKSYIDGSSVRTGISLPAVSDRRTDGRVYNLKGMQVGTGYHGIVIKNGRKIIQK